MSETLHVRARRAPAVDSEIEPAGFFGQLQWMPPGNSKICATANGKAKKIEVTATAQTAQLVDRRIKEMIAEAHGGKAALPFIDFDHADGEAAAWAQSASWGGDDKLTGGVRLHIEWSEVGRAKVKGKSYQGFSPEFKLSDNGEVKDVSLNLGGLVNRPAFTGIQRVTAAHSMIEEAFEAEIVSDVAADLFVKASAVLQAQQRLGSIVEAATIVARQNPALYENYRASLGGPQSERESMSQSVQQSGTSNEFVIRAKQIAEARKIDEVAAAQVLCRESPELYDAYRAGLGAKGPIGVKAKKAMQPSEELTFVVEAKELTEKDGIDLVQAATRLAAAKPHLYSEYLEDLGKRR